MNEQQLEQRLSAIERRLSALEGPAERPRAGPACKRCSGTEREFVSSEIDPHFGVFGDTVDKYRCTNCGLEVVEHVGNHS